MRTRADFTPDQLAMLHTHIRKAIRAQIVLVDAVAYIEFMTRAPAGIVTDEIETFVSGIEKESDVESDVLMAEFMDVLAERVQR